MSNSRDAPVLRTELRDHLKLLNEGKVREIYELDEVTLLFVATDRISAYDVIMKNGIPMKGALLTLLSRFWFQYLTSKIPHLRTHYLAVGIPKAFAERLPFELAQQLHPRTMQVRRLKVFKIESIVRGYLSGSAWASYKKTGMVNGEKLREGYKESEKLDKPLWTPSTKAELGEHDENISIDEASKLIGPEYASRIATLSLEIYNTAAEYARSRGIIIADTKFEFALDEAAPADAAHAVVLVDEVLTPDSSRFWRVDDYEVGRSQKSLDKQFLRDWLTKEGVAGQDGVEVPEEVAKGTSDGYKEAYKMVVGEDVEVALKDLKK